MKYFEAGFYGALGVYTAGGLFFVGFCVLMALVLGLVSLVDR